MAMVTDLRYAIRQVGLARDVTGCGRLDCIQRALDALERCLERAEDAENRLDRLEASGVDTGAFHEPLVPCEVDDVSDADLEALFAAPVLTDADVDALADDHEAACYEDEGEAAYGREG